MKKFSVKALAYAGVCVALGVVLAYFAKIPMPQGGSVTACSMFVVALVGWWFGPAVGFCASVAYGLLQFAVETNPQAFASPLNMLLDYPLAFGALGLMSLFRKWKSPAAIYVGFGAAALGRAFFSTISGILFYGQWAWDGWGVVPYSIVYNLGYIVPEMVLTYVVISIPAVKKALERVAP